MLPSVRDPCHEKFAEIKWSPCEDILHEAVSDTLFLLDCCHAAGAAARPLRGYSETIAASSWESPAPPPGPHSFTSALTHVLRHWAGSARPFSVITLHNEILVFLKEVPPQHIQELVEYGNQFEWRKTPVHFIRSIERFSSSIVLSPLSKPLQVPEIIKRSSMYREPHSAVEPMVLLDFTLAEDIPADDSGAYRRWLVSFPSPIKTINVQGVVSSRKASSPARKIRLSRTPLLVLRRPFDGEILEGQSRYDDAFIAYFIISMIEVVLIIPIIMSLNLKDFSGLPLEQGHMLCI